MKVSCAKVKLANVVIISAFTQVSLEASARDYFDPSLLSINGAAPSIQDLSIFEDAERFPPGNYLVTLHVNHLERGQQYIKFDYSSGELIPELTPGFLAKMGVDINSLKSFSGLPPDEPINNLSELIPEAKSKFDFSQLRLDLSIPQAAMMTDSEKKVDPSLWDQGIPAMLLNYNISGGHSKYDNSSYMSKMIQKNIYIGLNGGLNFQAWRLRSSVSGSYNENSTISGKSYSHKMTSFSNTYLQRDIQSLSSDMVIGENSTGSDVLDSFPFKGIKLSSSEYMLPNKLRGFAPVISGIAQSDAQITVSQNGTIIYRTNVSPGPFRINDLYQTGQGGDLTVVVKERDGTIRSWRQAISSLPVMLRQGRSKYELTVGRFNSGVTRSSREAPFSLATLIYGLPHDITLYGGGIISENYNSFSAGSGMSLGSLGALSADVTSSSAMLNKEKKTGQSYRVRYTKSLLKTGTSVDLTAFRYSTHDYYSFSDFNTTGYSLREGEVPWALARQRSDLNIRLSQYVQNFGSLYVSGSRTDYWGREGKSNVLSVGYNGSVKGISYGINYNLSKIQSGKEWRQNSQVAFNMQIPFSILMNSPFLNGTYATYQVSRDSSGIVQNQAGISGSLEDERFSYNIMHGWNNDSEIASNTSSLNLGWNGESGMLNGSYSQGSNFRNITFNGSGGAVLHNDGLTLGKQMGLNSSIAVVRAPGAAGVTVMNRAASTDSRGNAIVPYLSPYQNNVVSLDVTSLPEDVDLPINSTNVYPTSGAVVSAKFTPRKGYQALITLNRVGGVTPFGSIVTLISGDNEINNSIVGEAGQVYISGLPERGTIKARWGKDTKQSCIANFSMKDARISKNNPIRILIVKCEEE